MLVSPILPDGTSVYTGAARYRLETRTTPRRAMLETFGQPSYAYALGHLGLGADEIARRLFAGTVSPVQILRRHTLFGFARHFLTNDQEQAVVELLRTEDVFKGSRGLWRYFDLRFGPCRTDLAWACCGMCIAEDQAKGELPAWMVLHQPRCIQCCFRHGVLLHSFCSCCHRPFDMGDVTLPTLRCRHCGAKWNLRSTRAANLGQKALARLCARVFNDLVFVLRPLAWNRLMCATAQETGHAGGQMLASAVKRRWGVRSLAELGSLIGQPMPEDAIEAELQRLTVKQCAVRLIVLDAIEALLGHEFVVNSGVGSGRNDDELHRLAAENFVPLGCIDRLLKGEGLVSVMKVARGGNQNRIETFARETPASLWRNAAELTSNCRNDRLVIKAFQNAEPSECQRLHRTRIERAIVLDRDPARARFNRVVRADLEYARAYDREWLDRVLPRKKRDLGRLTAAERKGVFRNEVESDIVSNPSALRHEVRKRHKIACAWLQKYDPVWFEDHLPRKLDRIATNDPALYPVPFVRPRIKLLNRYRSDGQKRSTYRAYVRDLLKLNPQLSRDQIYRVGACPVRWLRRNDLVWLDKRLPARLK